MEPSCPARRVAVGARRITASPAWTSAETAPLATRTAMTTASVTSRFRSCARGRTGSSARCVGVSTAAAARQSESLSATSRPPPPRAPNPLTHTCISPSDPPPWYPTGARRGRRLLGRRRRARRLVPFHGRGEQRQIRGAQKGQVSTRRAVAPPRRTRLRRHRHRRRRSHRSPKA